MKHTQICLKAEFESYCSVQLVSYLPELSVYFPLVLWKASSWVPLRCEIISTHVVVLKVWTWRKAYTDQSGILQLCDTESCAWNGFWLRCLAEKALSNRLFKCLPHGFQVRFSGVASGPRSVCINVQQCSLQSPKLIDNSLLSLS